MKTYSKSYSYIIFLILICESSYSQMIDNQLNVTISYQNNIILGSDFTNKDNFIYPSFYNNFNNSNTISISGIYAIYPHFSVGMAVDFTSLSSWQLSEEYENYKDSRASLISIMPIFQYNIKYQDKGMYNKIQLSVQLNPVLGRSSINLKHPTFVIVPDLPGEITPPLSSKDFFVGIEVSTGIEYEISNNFGASFRIGSRNCWTSSILHNDQSFHTVFLEFGVHVRLMKSKRFLY